MNRRPIAPPLVAQMTQVIATSSAGLPAREFAQSMTTGPRRREQDVVRVEVEVDEPLALERDLVETVVQLGERSRVTGHLPGPPAKIRQHRRPVDTLEHECVVEHFQHTRHGIAVRAGVLHDLSLPCGPAARLEAPEHTAVAQLEDLRGASLRQHPHGP